MKASELLKRIESKSALLFVDARSDIEFQKGHIPGAVHAQVWKILLKRVQLPQDKNVEMVIACGHGPAREGGEVAPGALRLPQHGASRRAHE